MSSRAARPDHFRCPFCSAVSHNAYDRQHAYCARCRVFAPDVIEAPREVRQVMAEIYQADAARHVDRAEQLRRTAAAWLYLNAVDPGAAERR